MNYNISSPRLDIAYFKKRAFLSDEVGFEINVGVNFKSAYEDPVKFRVSTAYRVGEHENLLTIEYPSNRPGQTWETQWIPIETTPCNYGNERYWFLCPLCSRRCGILFYLHSRFACLRCNRIHYESQSVYLANEKWKRDCVFDGLLDNFYGKGKKKMRYWYAGKPTRLNKRLTKLCKRFGYSPTFVEPALKIPVAKTA
jgi:hypothetical protein